MVLVIKSGQDVALERYIFSLQTVVQPGPSEMSRWNKDMVYVISSRRFLANQTNLQLQNSKLVAISCVAATLSFISCKVKFSRGAIGRSAAGWLAFSPYFHIFHISLTPAIEDMSFGIFLELQDGASPSAFKGSVSCSALSGSQINVTVNNRIHRHG
jgi:hypothetical protein